MTATPAANEGHGPEVLYEVADHVATITLNRPHRRNAISVRMLTLLTELFSRADDDGDVRVVILTGAGKGFSPASWSVVSTTSVTSGIDSLMDRAMPSRRVIAETAQPWQPPPIVT